ncbi:DUF6233 domain-containing protein [Streptomyces sp. NPDC059928]|uniref:DUF6233 domain-containing protein n=1 Tax=unclassified Streptomyces TaxID=2593676 RepID=UPI0036468FE7
MSGFGEGMTRLDTLLFTRRVVEQNARHALAQLDEWISTERRREGERARAAERRPPPAEWLLEGGLDRRISTYVHTGDCWSAKQSSRVTAITRDQARQELADGTSPCPQCQPDNALGVME